MIALVCTDRGRHRRWFIAEVDPADPERPRRGIRRTRDGWVSHDTARPGYDPLYADGARRLECTKCGRAPQLSPERMRTLVEGLAAEGVERFDLSSLPD